MGEILAYVAVTCTAVSLAPVTVVVVAAVLVAVVERVRRWVQLLNEGRARVTDERCMSCRFFEREEDMGAEDLDKGLCKRFPPSASYDPSTDTVVTSWPLVDWVDRCGEWRRS